MANDKITMLKLKRMLQLLDAGKSMSQGSIFNGLKSRFYPDCKSVYGIVISPRCDIEQKKAPLYYYLPVVREGYKKGKFTLLGKATTIIIRKAYFAEVEDRAVRNPELCF